MPSTFVYYLLLILLQLSSLTICNTNIGIIKTTGNLANGRNRGNEDRRVLLISFDGLRSDYINIYSHLLGNLTFVAKHVRAEYVRPIFPSLTFPNHHTMATGVYAETHGIVHNSFLDPVSGQLFSKTMDEAFWNAVDPIWVTGERQKVKTAMYMWPGSAVNFNGTRPSFITDYNESIPLTSRIDTMLGHLLNDGVKLAMMYFHEPDKTAHHYGPDSRQIKKSLEIVNDGVGYLLQRIDSAKLTNKLDVLIVSDHGLSTINTHNVIAIDEMIGGKKFMSYFFDPNQHWMFSQYKVDAMVYSAVVHLWPRDGKLLELYDRLISRNNPNVKIYLKEDIPAEFHYRNNPRIAPLIMVAEIGWQIVLYRDVFEKTFLYEMDGMHGYDNREPEMRASFYAMGPSFASHVVLEAFDNVNIYSLIAKLAGVRPQPNNGSIYAFLPALKTGVEPRATRQLRSNNINAVIKNSATERQIIGLLSLLFISALTLPCIRYRF